MILRLAIVSYKITRRWLAIDWYKIIDPVVDAGIPECPPSCDIGVLGREMK